MEQVIEVWLVNEPGALMRVAHILTTKGFNIDRPTVGPDRNQQGIAQMTIVADVEPRFRVRLIKEIERLVNVFCARDVTGNPCAHSPCKRLKFSSPQQLVLLAFESVRFY